MHGYLTATCMMLYGVVCTKKYVTILSPLFLHVMNICTVCCIRDALSVHVLILNDSYLYQHPPTCLELEVWTYIIDQNKEAHWILSHNNVHDSKTYTEWNGAHCEGVESLTVGLAVGGPTINTVLTYFLRVNILSVSF